MNHLGDVVAALVDGELGHDARERAHRHLAACPPCRTEVVAHRRLKACLAQGPVPVVNGDLTARLLSVSHQALPSRLDPLGPADLFRPSGPGRAGLAMPRPRRRRPRPDQGSRARRSHRRPGERSAEAPSGPPESVHRSSTRRRVAAGATLLLLGSTAALALGSPRAVAPTPSLTPRGAVLLTRDVRIPDPAPVFVDARLGVPSR